MGKRRRLRLASLLFTGAGAARSLPREGKWGPTWGRRWGPFLFVRSFPTLATTADGRLCRRTESRRAFLLLEPHALSASFGSIRNASLRSSFVAFGSSYRVRSSIASDTVIPTEYPAVQVRKVREFCTFLWPSGRRPGVRFSWWPVGSVYSVLRTFKVKTWTIFCEKIMLGRVPCSPVRRLRSTTYNSVSVTYLLVRDLTPIFQ